MVEKDESDTIVKELTQKKDEIETLQYMRRVLPEIYYDVVKDIERDQIAIEEEKKEHMRLNHDLQFFADTQKMEICDDENVNSTRKFSSLQNPFHEN